MIAIGLVMRDVQHHYAPGRGSAPASLSHRGAGCVAVRGQNGSGKSTLLRMVAGLLRPTAGTLELTLDGRPVAADRRRDVVGLASPELSFYDELSVGENLAFVAGCRGLANRAAAVREALDRVGLSERAGDRVAALSSGMIQRLRLAFALLHRPPLLLLDEPGSHLDDAGRRVTDAIVAEHRAGGLVLIATNDEREGGIADTSVQLRGGLGRTV